MAKIKELMLDFKKSWPSTDYINWADPSIILTAPDPFLVGCKACRDLSIGSGLFSSRDF